MSIHLRSKIIGGQFIIFSLMMSGLGLLFLTLLLITNILETEPTTTQSRILSLLFIILFAITGFGLLLIGLLESIQILKRIKETYKHLGDSETIPEIPLSATQHPTSRSLQVIRPSMPSKTSEITTREEREKVVDIPKKEIMQKETIQKKESEKVKKEPITPETAEDFTYNDGLQNIADRYNDEKVKKAFKNWHNTLMITFPDISKSFLFKIDGDEGLELSEGTDSTSAVQVKMDSTVFVKMMTKKINPIKAYSSGNLEVKGEMKNMLKLRKLMF